MKLLREPLLQFAILGGVLFAVYALASDAFSADESRLIEMDEAQIEFLAANWKRQWQRSPTEEELRALVDARVREEVLYREAVAVGLDQNDIVVRRRMVQKMEMLSQDLALLVDPTDTELQTFFDGRREEYRVPPRLSFSHIYFNVDGRGQTVEDDARRVLAELKARIPIPERAPELGDRFMLQYDYSLRAPIEVQQQFGSYFAEEIFKLEPGWQGPVASGYGVHLVYVGDRVEARIPELAEVRDRVVNDFNRERAQRANRLLYEGLRTNYGVVIDEEAVARARLGAAANP
jgi:hypothetical protein